ncbi:hypothetical protein YQE_05993, partial [Dendroctonus ponderosae]
MQKKLTHRIVKKIEFSFKTRVHEKRSSMYNLERPHERLSIVNHYFIRCKLLNVSKSIQKTETMIMSYKTARLRALMSRKLLIGEELENAVNQVVRELEDEKNEGEREEYDRQIDSDTDQEEEVVTKDLYSSESEQSEEELDIVAYADQQCQQEDDYCFFIGRDNETIWISKPLSSGKTKAKNIIKILPGPKGSAKNIHKEVDAFSLFITDQMIADIVTNTNIYIEKKKIEVEYSRPRDCRETTKTEMIADIVTNTNIYIEKKKIEVEYSRPRDCRETTKTEVKALLGALFFIGIKKGSHTNVLELWDQETGMILLRALFSYKRFLFLLRALRFDNVHTREDRRKTDKLAPIRDFHQEFVSNCIANFNVGEFVTIDEMLHSFRGRCSFVQYIPNKPAKYGIKITNEIDEDTQKPLANLDYNATKGGVDTVDQMCASYSTSRITRRWPLTFLKKNKAVILLSTMHSTNEIDEDTQKPLANLDYNATKGGVDTVDQMCASYSTSRITRRWPLTVFFRHLDISGINSNKLQEYDSSL